MMLQDTEEQLRGRGVITRLKWIEALSKPMIPYAEAFIAAMKAQNVKYAVTSTLRTMAEQISLYAQGRQPLDKVNELRIKAGFQIIGMAENKYKVTQCDGVRIHSPHQDGIAMDIVPLSEHGNPCWPPFDDSRWGGIVACGEAIGLIWGGRWKDFPDYPHWQYGGVA